MRLFIAFVVLCIGPVSAIAQDPDPATNGHSHDSQSHSSMPAMEMNMSGTPPRWMPSPHASSGTGWQPAVAPLRQWMKRYRGWDLMAHGALFIGYNQQGGPRGAGKTESVNWLMLMEQHSLGTGTILFRQMFSAESLTAPHPGFPQLFQTGETYHGEPLVDHQHPHNVFAELSLSYTQPLNDRVAWLLYGGPAAEPALGPVAFMHRASASELPMPPLSHHLQDSTHTSFGVITTGLIVDRLRLEGSVFNGREPNEQRYGIQLAALDSWSARASIAPSSNWTAQYSYGRIEHPEALEPGSERRQTASVEYVRPISRGSWATSIVWGRKHKELESRNLNSYLLESTLNFKSRNYAFSRLELVDKDELFPDDSSHTNFRIGALTFGGARDLLQTRLLRFAAGADVTFYSKPGVLDATYGRTPVSFQIFLRLRPGLDHMRHQSGN